MNIERLVNAEEVSGHTALLPTKNKTLVDFDELEILDNAKKILALVYKNLEEATSGPYIYKKTTVTLSYGGEIFTAIGIQNQELGWKKNRPDETVEQPLPIEFQNVQKGDRVHIKGVTIEQHQTEPPERFTDGTLLQAMESAGKSSAEDDAVCVDIGTAATRAPNIKNLVQRKYVISIREAFENPKDASDYDLLYEAARCRQLADWIVGMNGTKFFSLRYDKNLSVGRVKSPTLAMIVDREKEIKSFVPKRYYTVKLNVERNGETVTFESNPVNTEEEAIRIEEKCRGGI